MKICPNCGARMSDAAEYCGRCGAVLGAAGERPITAPRPPGYPSPPPPGYPPQPGVYAYGAAPPPVHFAGFWIRFLAYMIDWAILAVATSPLIVLLVLSDFWTVNNGIVEFHWTALRVSLLILMVAAVWLYAILMLGRYGATLGKMAVGIKVVRRDLTPVGYGTAALRETIGKWLSSFLCSLGYIWAGFDPYKRAWHDHIAATLVIYK